LLSSPTPEAIIAFRASEATQERVRQLFSANKEGRLTAEQRNEMDELERVNHFMTMLKGYAR
jgi:hypothetical protein